MPLGLLAGLASASGLFNYNRENFFFDKQQQIKLEYQAQEMTIRQFELYREDVRDLVSLTIGKMDNYLIVNTLQLGFCFTLFSEGRPKPGTEQWLGCLFSLCNAGAFMYYLLSMWLAMHASVSAHAFGVRLLTQFVRLPVPGSAELDRARAVAEDFEGRGVRDMLRVPVWKQQIKRLQAAMEDRAVEAMSDAGSDAGDSVIGVADPAMNPVAMMRHVQLFRKLQANWQSYDAYARVCMAMGTNQLLHSLSYCTLGLLEHENNVPIPALCCVVTFTAGAFVLGKLDLYLSRRILAVAATLLVTPPVLTTASMVFKRSGILGGFWEVLVVIVYSLHVAWIAFTVFGVAKAESFSGVLLPTKFRSVLFLDVFGWLAEDEGEEEDPDGVDGDGPTGENANANRGDLSTIAERESVTWVMTEESMAAEGDSLPQNVRPILLADCRQLEDQVRTDLRRWESHGIAELSRSDQREFKRLRRLFDALASELQRNTRPDDEAAAAASLGEEAELPVYLQLEYNPEGDSQVYYYQCETEEYLWEAPQERCRISDNLNLERDIAKLGNKVRALARCSCSPCPQGQRPAASSGQRRQGDEQPNRIPRSTSAGTTFRGGHDRGHPSRRGSSGHLPGRLPWSVVVRGSMALIAAWLVATVGTILALLGIVHIEFDRPVQPEIQTLEGLVPVAGADGWPHRFPRPLGLACAPEAGPIALVVERYAVHELQLESDELFTGPARWFPAVEACLHGARGFRGRGLADVGLDCIAEGADGGGRCTAALLGADGKRVLHCNLSDQLAGRAKALDLLGGPWRALAPGGSEASWVLGDDWVPTQLRSHSGLEKTLHPVFDLHKGNAASVAALHALGNHTLLGLEPDGQLHAWALRGGSMRTWRLPAVDGTRWTGLCTTGGQLYLAGFGERKNAAAGIWRVPLPPELLAALAGMPPEEPILAVGGFQVYSW